MKRTATNPTRSHGRSRSRRKSSTKIGYTSRLMVKGVRSEVNGQPLLSARSTWSRWWRKARATTPRSIHSPRVNRSLREAAGWVATADVFTDDLQRSLSCQCQDSGYDGAVTTTPRASNDARPYHHGDLPRVLLEAAVEAIDEVGPAAVSMRDLARRAR